jgi:hypothetical protein
MRWVRSHLFLGSRLALFALSIQLALSFGHVHFNGFAPSTDFARFIAAVDGRVLPAAPDGETAPQKQKHSGLPDDICAIFSLIHLAATALPSASPALPLPIVLSTILHDLRTSGELAASRPALFQARAPPLA